MKKNDAEPKVVMPTNNRQDLPTTWNIANHLEAVK